MDDKYRYICSVAADVHIYAASIADRSIYPGDLVTLKSGVQGYVKHVVLMNTEDERYAMLCDFVPVDEIVEIYRHIWSKPEESEEQ